MFINKKKRSPDKSRIGDIFTEAGMVNVDLVDQSLAIAKNAKLPLGRVLVMSGHLNDREVASALEAQRGIREGRYSKEYAAKLMRMVHCNNVSIDEAAALLSWEQAYSTQFSQLGKLLQAAQLLEEETLLIAQREADSQGIPLGGYLAKTKMISLELLENALNVMVLVRDNKVTRIDGVQALKKVGHNLVDLRHALRELGLEHVLDDDRIRLAELLIASGVLEEHIALDALEHSIENKEMIGQVFMKVSAFAPLVLEAALQLQEMVASGVMRVERACDMIVLVKEMDVPLEQLLSELDRINEVAHFIRKSGLLDDKELRALAATADDFENNFGRVLLQSGLVGPKVVGHASYCLSLYEMNELLQQEAYALLKHCVQNNVEPHDAIYQLGLGQHSECRFGEQDLLGKTA
jgi:hypothetical protein